MLNRLFIAAAAAVLAAGSSARADFVIDDFSVPGLGSAYNTTLTFGGAPFSATDPSATGVTRLATVTVISDTIGGGTAQVRLGTFATGSLFSQSTADGLTAVANLLYSYTAPQDLSVGGTAVSFTFGSADLNTPFAVNIEDSNGASATIYGVVNSTNFSVPFSLPLSAFLAASPGLDLTQVSSIELILNQDAGGASVPSADFNLRDVRITTPNAIPAPPAGILALAALPMLALYRRRAAAAATA